MLAANLPGETRTGALAIYDHWQANRDEQAAALAAVMAAAGVATLYLVNKLTRRRRHGF
jgi:ABC-type molybdate transport system permease subunit